MKKILALIWVGILCLGLLLSALCGKEPQGLATPDTATPEQPAQQAMKVCTPDTPEAPQEVVRLQILNGQPVLQLIWDQLSEEFALQTGIRVEVVASQTHLQGQDPVMFSVSGSEELGQWACMDLTEAVAYANLASEKFTLTDGEKVCGIASEAEPFGLIYNTDLLARVGYTEADIDAFIERLSNGLCVLVRTKR
jgi:ABC-type glycerol-3-phosphate transport system substrate-binding protein